MGTKNGSVSQGNSPYNTVYLPVGEITLRMDTIAKGKSKVLGSDCIEHTTYTLQELKITLFS